MKATESGPRTVLYVITKASWGGAQRYVYDLMEYAKQRGDTPILIYGKTGLLVEKAEEAAIASYCVPSLMRDISPLNDLRALGACYTLCKRLHADVVHLNSSKASAVGALAARLAGVRHIIFTAHGWAFNESRSSLSKILFMVIHYGTVVLATHTIVVSEALRRHVRSWPFVQHKISVIKNGIAPEPVLSREEARRALVAHDQTLSENGIWVGTVAELHTNKGIDVGIEAWKEITPESANWVLIGDGEKEEELRAQSAAQANVHFLGFIPDSKKYMKAFDIFFLPSRTEALGYVLLEAGNARVPVVATDVGGIPEIIEHEKTGLLVQGGDYTGMRTALVRLIEDERLRRTLGDVLYAHVTEHFSKKRMLEETFAQYKH